MYIYHFFLCGSSHFLRKSFNQKIKKYLRWSVIGYIQYTTSSFSLCVITLKWQIICLLKSCDGVLLAVANTEVTLLHCVFSFKKIIINVTEKKNWAFVWERNVMEKTLSKYIKTYDYRIKDWLHVITYYLKKTAFIRLLSFRRSWSSGRSDFTDKMF